MDLMDDGLFAGFEPEAKRPRQAAVGPTHREAAPVAAVQRGALGLPPPFASMQNECVASVLYSEHIDAESRQRLERVFRESTVAPLPPGAAPPTNAAPAAVAEGAVHYFQAFSADYAGAASAAAAAATPSPAYDRLLETPFPHDAPTERPRGNRRPKGFQGRYFDAPTSSSARPGMLSAELRAQLGIGPNDPPPFLARMQALGYPPGYMGDPNAPADEVGELEFFTAASGAGAAGEPPGSHVPLVDFPGLNVPPPAGADPRMWGWRGPVVRPAPT